MRKKKILITGAGGFIGGYLVNDLVHKGHIVIAADIKPIDQWFQISNGAINHSECDMRLKENCYRLSRDSDRIYNLACNMGGMGFIQNNHALCMESVLIQTHMLMAARDNGVREILYSSSACVYPVEAQSEVKDSKAQGLKEEYAYPANPEDGYGWEKLFSEIITQYFDKDFGIDHRICRFHNVYGPHGSWKGGREKAPAALCRKIIEAKRSGNHVIEVWGDGEQTRSFLYIDDCITGMEKIWSSGYKNPLNLGSCEMVSVNNLIEIISEIAGIKVEKRYDLSKPQGVRGRNSDNTLIKKITGWEPSISLKEGLEKTYAWIKTEIENN
ncbi:MAG: NAD-dependent dehydratase [Candidatus Marinimicrobia bacterium]|nr:NAD-dependent dehydratase [Candidatus Neomarinimicrobiota bacterium]|tara:strand:- start:1856 stop:2839 length:984 start_codon:yes stop_codon:yes gene_type:complete